MYVLAMYRQTSASERGTLTFICPEKVRIPLRLVITTIRVIIIIRSLFLVDSDNRYYQWEVERKRESERVKQKEGEAGESEGDCDCETLV